MSKVIRCIPEKEFKMIRDGEWQFDKVRVYYGLNCYNDDIKHVNLLAGLIRIKHPDIKRTDMHIHRVTRTESISHAKHTMVQIFEDTETVRNNLSDYCIL